MRNFLLGIFITVIVVLVFRQCTYKPRVPVVSQSDLIEEQIKNVGKLVVSEGHFSEVLTYRDSKELFGSYFTADKKALVVAQSDVTIAYDLSLLDYQLNVEEKILNITFIPNAEISIYPEFEYYDVQSDFLNPFEAADYNNIKAKVKKDLLERVNRSNLKSNAQNRLLSELSKFFILTKSMGWTLQYKQTIVSSEEDLEDLLL
jgi:hypothetical protein